MILSLFRGLSSFDLLVELRESLITVRKFSSDDVLEIVPVVAVDNSSGKPVVREIGKEASNIVGVDIEIVKPFSHPRSLVSNFKYAEEVIQYAIRKIHNGIFRPAPRVVMHQLDKIEGGLTDVERRVLFELGYGAGARKVMLHEGAPINVKTESYESVGSRSDT